MLFIVGLIVLGLAPIAHPKTVNDHRNGIVSHLRSEGGYTVTFSLADDSIILVKSATEPDFSIRVTDEGLLFVSFFIGSRKAKSDVIGFLRFVRELNEQAMLVRYYIDSDMDLVIEALFPGNYDPDLFSIFLTWWREDLQRFIKREDAQEWIN